MTTQEGMTAYQLAYNEAMVERAAQRDADRGVRTWLADDKGLTGADADAERRGRSRTGTGAGAGRPRSPCRW